PRGSADLRGKVGEGLEVVAGDRGGAGELAARELHAVTRVAAESDRDGVDLPRLLLGLGLGGWQGPARLALHRSSPWLDVDDACSAPFCTAPFRPALSGL